MRMTINRIILVASSILLCISGLPILEPQVVVRARTGLFPGRGRGRQVDLTRVLPTSGQFWLNVDDGYFACQVNSTETFVKVFKISRLCDGLSDCFQGSDELKDFLNCSDKCKSNNCGHQGACLETSNLPKCYCNLGFRGDSCEKVHITQCTDSSCPPNAECIHTSEKSSCGCKQGFIEDGSECVPDIAKSTENQDQVSPPTTNPNLEETIFPNSITLPSEEIHIEDVDFTTEISTQEDSSNLVLSSSTLTTGSFITSTVVSSYFHQNESSSTSFTKNSSHQPVVTTLPTPTTSETTTVRPDSTISTQQNDILSTSELPSTVNSNLDQVIPLDSQVDEQPPSEQPTVFQVVDSTERNQDQFDNQLQQVLSNVKKALERFLKQQENGPFDLEKKFEIPKPDLKVFTTTETIVAVTPATVRSVADPNTSNVTGTLDILNELKTLLRSWTSENSNLEERFTLNQGGSDFKIDNRLRDSSSSFQTESPENMRFPPKNQSQNSTDSTLRDVELSRNKTVDDYEILRSSDIKDEVSGNFSICVEDYTICKSSGSDICNQQFNACSIKILESSKVDKYTEDDPLEFVRELNNQTTIKSKCVQSYITCLFKNDSGCAETYNNCDARNETYGIEARNDEIESNEQEEVLSTTSLMPTTPLSTTLETFTTTSTKTSPSTTFQTLNKFPTDKSNMIETSEKPLKETTPCVSMPPTFGSFSGSPAQSIADCTWDFFGCSDHASSSGSSKNCCQARFDSCSHQVDAMKAKKPSILSSPKPQTTASLITSTENMQQTTIKPSKPLNSLAECIWAFYSCEGGKSECQKSFDNCNKGKRDTDVICAEAAEDPRKYLVPHPTDCNKFYSCQNLGWRGGWLAHLMDCPVSTVFDPKLRICNFPRDVGECRKGKTFALFQEIYAIAARQTRQKQDTFQIPDVGYISSKNIVHSTIEEQSSSASSCQSTSKITFSPTFFTFLIAFRFF